MGIADELDALLRALDEPAARQAVPDAARAALRRSLTEARLGVEAGDDRAVERALEVAAHHVSDVWPFDEPIGGRVLTLAQRRRQRER